MSEMTKLPVDPAIKVHLSDAELILSIPDHGKVWRTNTGLKIYVDDSVAACSPTKWYKVMPSPLSSFDFYVVGSATEED